MKIYKLTERSRKSLEVNVKRDFQNVQQKYLDEASGPFDVKVDGLELTDGFYEIPDYLTLKPSLADDFENAKLIYETLSGLSPLDADDGRLWTYLTHVTFYDYVKERWTDALTKEKVIIDRFHYLNGTNQGVRTRNAISRLWWAAHLTVRKNETDEKKKWELTKALLQSSELFVSIMERNYATYENVRTGFLEFYVENKLKLNSKKIQELARDFNNAGGVYSLPFLEKTEVKERLERMLTASPVIIKKKTASASSIKRKKKKVKKSS